MHPGEPIRCPLRCTADRVLASGTGSGAPRSLHQRRIEVSSEDKIWEFIDHNPLNRIRQYSRSVIPEIHIHDKLGDVGDLYKKIEQEYRDAQRAFKPGSRDEAAVLKERDKVFRELDVLFQRLRGINPHNDPSKFGATATANIKKYNQLKYMMQFVIASMPDPALPIFQWGLEPFENLMVASFRDFDSVKIAARELEIMAIAPDMVTGTRLARIGNLNNNRPIGGRGIVDALQGTLDTAVDNFGIYSMGNAWNSTVKKYAGLIVTDKTMRDALRFADGEKLSPHAFAKYEQMGLDPAKNFVKIAEEFRTNGHGQVIEGRLHVANSTQWNDKALAKKFTLSLMREVDSIIVTPRLANDPLYADYKMMQLILQFRRFQFNAMPMVLMSNLQNPDKDFFSGLLAAVGMGAITYFAKAKINGYDIPWDNPREIMVNAIDRSGVLSYIMDANMLVERVTAGRLGINPILGDTTLSRYAQRDIIGALFGPTVKTIEDVAASLRGGTNLITGNEVPAGQRHSIWRSIPGSNLFYLEGLYRAVHEVYEKSQ